MKLIKDQINLLSKEQKFFKSQRKTVNLVGERKLEYYIAQARHQDNRFNLRYLYAAYGLMRGKTFSQIENKYSEEEHPLNKYKGLINSLIEKYSEEAVCIGE